MPETVRNWPSVAVVLVTWNNGKDTLECLESLSHLQYPNYSVIVVDNGSSDGSGELIKTMHPETELLPLSPNRGYAGGCNPGIRRALGRGAEFVWLLNNDTVVQPDALTRMVELAYQRLRLGAVGSVLRYYNSPERIQAWGGGRVFKYLGISRHFRQRVAPGYLNYLTGASLLLRAEALRDVGIFDERFYLYWEDTDLCFRLQSGGWEIAVADASSVYHKVGAATGVAGSGKRPPCYYQAFNESLVLFFFKHSPVPHLTIGISVTARVLKWLFFLDLKTVTSVIRGAGRGLQRAKAWSARSGRKPYLPADVIRPVDDD